MTGGTRGGPARSSIPRSTTRASHRCSSRTWTAATVAETRASTRPGASSTTRSSRCGTPSAPRIRSTPSWTRARARPGGVHARLPARARPSAGVVARGQRDEHDDGQPRGPGARGRGAQGPGGRGPERRARGGRGERASPRPARRGRLRHVRLGALRSGRGGGDQDARVRLRRRGGGAPGRRSWATRRRPGRFLRRSRGWRSRLRSLHPVHARPARGRELGRSLRPAPLGPPREHRLHRGERLAALLVRARRTRRRWCAPWAATRRSSATWTRSSTRTPRWWGRTRQPTSRASSASTRTATSPATTSPTCTRWAGRPDRVADRVRQILDTQYRAAPDGLAGNEDCGQMSAWYVFSALGFYPADPASGVYVLGVPRFDEARMRVQGGTFVVRAVRGRPGRPLRALRAPERAALAVHVRAPRGRRPPAARSRSRSGPRPTRLGEGALAASALGLRRPRGRGGARPRGGRRTSMKRALALGLGAALAASGCGPRPAPAVARRRPRRRVDMRAASDSAGPPRRCRAPCTPISSRPGGSPIPSTGDHEAELGWIEDEDWIYRRDFDVDARLLDEAAVELVFEGLDTYADVALNGPDGPRRPTTSSGAGAWTCGTRSAPGTNTLEVRFASPVRVGRERAAASPWPIPHQEPDASGTRAFVRKAAYQFGWDWGPRYVTSGIWRPVRLEAWSGVRIRGARVERSLAWSGATRAVRRARGCGPRGRPAAVDPTRGAHAATAASEGVRSRRAPSRRSSRTSRRRPRRATARRDADARRPGGRALVAARAGRAPGHRYDVEVDAVRRGGVGTGGSGRIGLRTVTLATEPDSVGRELPLQRERPRRSSRAAPTWCRPTPSPRAPTPPSTPASSTTRRART